MSNTHITDERVRWTPVALATPEPARFWVCDSFHDKTYYDVAGAITHRSPAGTVRVSLDGFGAVGSPGIRSDRWIITQGFRYLRGKKVAVRMRD
jgi:hypothetical protein